MKCEKNILKVICVSTFLCGIIFSNKVFGAEFEAKISNGYKEWVNLPPKEKEEYLMPQTIFGEAPAEVLEKYNFPTDIPQYISLLLEKDSSKLENVRAEISKSEYNLNQKVNLRVENQKSTSECWAFSALKSLETNIAINNNSRDLLDFSERHMDYATTKTFTDGVNPIGYDRELGRGGLPVVANGYLTNGTGAVLEEDMPFEDNETRVSLSEIDKKADTIVTDYITLPTINKEYTKDEKGNTISVYYTDASGNQYTEESLKAARNIIKEHLVTKGAVTSITAANNEKYYDISNVFQANAYNCNSTSEKRDHAITIVGWDDNYSRTNFREGSRPSQNGAYLVLNSYGSDNFDHGYIYISYEDFFIESEIYGIQSSTKVDYDKIYQHDFYGGVFQVTAKGISSGYYGATYERDTSKNELLNNIGVTLAQYCKLEIYVNPNGSDLDLNKMIKVGETQNVMSPGYHRIQINPVELTSNEFAIVIKQYSQNEAFSFQVEARADGTAYGNVSSEDRSYFSVNGGVWQKLSTIGVSEIDMDTADVCIKAFVTEKDSKPEEPKPEEPIPDETEENKFSSEKYIIKDGYILNIPHETKKSEFIKNFLTNLEMSFFTEDDEELNSNEDELIKTGMKLKLSDGKNYNLIVRGDINKDGNLTLTDISKIIFHYNESKDFILTNKNSLKACDMNFDGEITLTDISQIVFLYNHI